MVAVIASAVLPEHRAILALQAILAQRQLRLDITLLRVMVVPVQGQEVLAEMAALLVTLVPRGLILLLGLVLADTMVVAVTAVLVVAVTALPDVITVTVAVAVAVALEPYCQVTVQLAGMAAVVAFLAGATVGLAQPPLLNLEIQGIPQVYALPVAEVVADRHLIPPIRLVGALLAVAEGVVAEAIMETQAVVLETPEMLELMPLTIV